MPHFVEKLHTLGRTERLLFFELELPELRGDMTAVDVILVSRIRSVACGVLDSERLMRRIGNLQRVEEDRYILQGNVSGPHHL